MARWAAWRDRRAVAAALLVRHRLRMADTFDPIASAGEHAGGGAACGSTAGAGNAIARTEVIIGIDSIVFPFVVPGGMPGGIVTVTLAGSWLARPMSSLSFAATTSTSLLAQLEAPGSPTFDISAPGILRHRIWHCGSGLRLGLYRSPELFARAAAPAAWLLLSGLHCCAGKETVINAR